MYFTRLDASSKGNPDSYKIVTNLPTSGRLCGISEQVV